MLPIKVRSIYSFCKSVLSIKKIVKKFKESGYSYAVLCDLNSLSGSYAFYKECKKNDIKPIIGCELYYDVNDSVLLFAKNRQGWFDLCYLLSKSQENKGRLDINRLKNLPNIICVSEKEISLTNIDTFIIKDLTDIRYFSKEELEDLRVILCSDMSTTLPKVEKLLQDNILFENSDFFKDLPEIDFDEKLNFDHLIENFEFEQKPILPKCYEGNEIEIIRELCRKGWSEKKTNLWDRDVYVDRVKLELEILEKFNLAGYFLIIKDLVDYARKNNWIIMARGSVGGSLVAYLLGISIADPIKHKLLLSRFINAARADGGGLPDIDLDIQTEHREKLIDYLRGKYGEDCVAQIITFSTLKGSGALKEVLRVYEACDFHTSNNITKHTPKEAKIAGQMNEDGETSIILWTLKKMPSIYKDYCTYDENGYHGDYAKYFEQAVRLEGVIKSTGKHAAGVLVSNESLYNKLPMMYDSNSDKLICGLEYTDAESTGLGVKLDVLGVAALSKVALFSRLLEFGKVDNDYI